MTLHLQEGELNWVRPQKELNINGHHFDVKKIWKNGAGEYTIMGLYDYAEAGIKKLKNQFAKQSATNSNAYLGWAFIPTSVPPSCTIPANIILFCSVINYGNMPADQYPARWMEVPTPPPL